MESEIVRWLLCLMQITAFAYLLLLMAYTIGWYRTPLSPPLLNANHPKVHVLIALRNESSQIVALVQSLRDQVYPSDRLLFILVDDHSEDDTFIRLEQAVKIKMSHQFLVLQAEKPGKKASLQQALRHEAADLIVVTDADCIHSPFWIAQLAAHYVRDKAVMCLGPVKISPIESLMQQLQALEFMSLIASTAGAAGLGVPSMANGANMAIDYNALMKAGGFNQKTQYASGEDVFLLLKLLRTYGSKKIRFVRSAHAMVTTQASPDWKSFMSQRMRWVSKSKAYRHPFIILPALIVFALNFSLVALSIAMIWIPYLSIIFLLFILVKYLIELPLMQSMANFMHSRKLLRWFLPMQFFYPFYVVITAVAGLGFKSSWKGRM